MRAQSSAGGPEVAAAEHHAISDILLDSFEERPLARADITLANGARVHRHRIDAGGKGPVENGEELVLALDGVVHASPHLERHRSAAVDGLNDCPHDRQRRFRVRQQITAPAAAEDLLDRTTEVDVHHVVAGLNQCVGRLGKGVGLGPHELAADRMIVRMNGGNRPALATLLNHQSIEHHLVERVGRAQHPRHTAHGQIAVTAQSGLDDGELERERAEAEHVQILADATAAVPKAEG